MITSLLISLLLFIGFVFETVLNEVVVSFHHPHIDNLNNTWIQNFKLNFFLINIEYYSARLTITTKQLKQFKFTSNNIFILYIIFYYLSLSINLSFVLFLIICKYSIVIYRGKEFSNPLFEIFD